MEETEHTKENNVESLHNDGSNQHTPDQQSRPSSSLQTDSSDADISRTPSAFDHSRPASAVDNNSRPPSAASKPNSTALPVDVNDGELSHLPSIHEKKMVPTGHGKPPRSTVVHHPGVKDVKNSRTSMIDSKRKQGTILKSRKKTEVKKVVEHVDVDMRRRGAKYDLNAKEEPKVEEDLDDPNMDPIERILRKREKKISIEVPSAPLVGTRIRKVMLKEKDMFHLIHEVKGTKFGPSCRPEITLLTVGKGACSNPDIGPSDFPGIEVLADFSKELFILSDRVEDKILTLYQADPIRACVINSALSMFEDECTDYYDVSMSRCWKRFVINHIIPQLSNHIRLVILGARVKRFMDNEIEEFGSACPLPP